MSDRNGFVPFGLGYGEDVQFFNRDDGYSQTLYFHQNFLLGCRYYRRFWVRRSWLILIPVLLVHVLACAIAGVNFYLRLLLWRWVQYNTLQCTQCTMSLGYYFKQTILKICATYNCFILYVIVFIIIIIIIIHYAKWQHIIHNIHTKTEYIVTWKC